jgi:hypothetical protein
MYNCGIEKIKVVNIWITSHNICVCVCVDVDECSKHI